MLPEIPIDESIWRRIQSLQIRVSRVELLATLQSVMQARNSQMARGFVACFGSELPPAQRRSLELIKPRSPIHSIESNPNNPQSTPHNPNLSLSESIKACYQRVLRSNSPADRAELRSLIARLPSFDEIESILRDCVKKDAIASQLEAKQFVLALLDASRLDEAESLARLLKAEFNVISACLAAHSVDRQPASDERALVAQPRSLRALLPSLFNKQRTLSAYTTPSNTATRTAGCTRSVPSDRSTPPE